MLSIDFYLSNNINLNFWILLPAVDFANKKSQNPKTRNQLSIRVFEFWLLNFDFLNKSIDQILQILLSAAGNCRLAIFSGQVTEILQR